MHSSTLLTSALAAGALALPYQLEKRQEVTVYDTVTVTITVYVNPYATPVWTAPHFPQTPPVRPSNAPPLWTPPHVGASNVAANPAPARTSSTSTGPAVQPVPTPTGNTPVVVAPIPTTTSVYTPPVVAPIGTTGVSSAIDVPMSAASSVNVPIVPTTTAPVVVSIGTTGVSSAIDVPMSAASSVNVPIVPTTTTPAVVSTVGPSHISGPAQATLSVGSDYQNAILFHHNEARANHGAGQLVWNDTVAQTASLAAQTCNFTHYIPTGAGQGQNLFTVSGDYFNVTAGITESWYKGEFAAMTPYFAQANIPDDVFHNVGHLTQVLWKGTTSVGCVSMDCGNNMIVNGVSGSPLNKYTVCNYFPAGNIGGQYAINVGDPISTTNLGSWTD